MKAKGIKYSFIGAATFLVAVFFMAPVEAKIGVGVGTAKIEMDEKLKPGGIYDLPTLTVRNTGDEESDYFVGIQFQEDIPEKKPSKDWFTLDPQEFHLSPDETRVVSISLRIPLDAEPGEYFCYAEARPKKTVEGTGGAVIGIASAAKVRFSIIPANLFQALYYKALYIWKYYAPWTYIFAVVLGLAVLIVFIRRFFTFQIGFGRNRKKTVDDHQKESFEEVLSHFLRPVEEYTASLSPEEVENIFFEVRIRKEGVRAYFYEHDQEILSQVDMHTRNILVALTQILRRMEKEHPYFYDRAEHTIVYGFLGK